MCTQICIGFLQLQHAKRTTSSCHAFQQTNSLGASTNLSSVLCYRVIVDVFFRRFLHVSVRYCHIARVACMNSEIMSSCAILVRIIYTLLHILRKWNNAKKNCFFFLAHIGQSIDLNRAIEEVKHFFYFPKVEINATKIIDKVYSLHSSLCRNASILNVCFSPLLSCNVTEPNKNHLNLKNWNSMHKIAICTY